MADWRASIIAADGLLAAPKDFGAVEVGIWRTAGMWAVWSVRAHGWAQRPAIWKFGGKTKAVVKSVPSKFILMPVPAVPGLSSS